MKISRSALLPYSTQECFLLVNDIPAYPEFLPNCADVEILEQMESEIIAKMTFSKAGISQSVITRNILVPGQSMVLELVEGPFHRFNGCWEFVHLSDAASKTVFSVDFEVKSVIANLVVDAAINTAATMAMSAFEKRAEEIYGKRL